MLPIFMAAFIAIINHFDTQGNRGSFKLVDPEKYNPTAIFPDFADIEEDRKAFSQVYYTPVTNLTTTLMETAKNIAGEQFVLDVIGIQDSKNFSDKLKNESGNPVTSVVGGVMFNVDLNQQRAPVNFNYSLIMTTFDQVNALFPKKMSAAPVYKDDKKNAYFSSNFIHLQCIINEAYLEVFSNGIRPFRPRILINKYPYPRYIDSPHIYSLKTFISRSNVIGFIAIIPIILKVICGEKERRIKEMMKLMGMNDLYYYGSIFLSHLVIALFDAAAITALYFLSHTGKPLLQYASITLVFFTLVLFVVCLLLFCITASTLFNKPVAATVFTLILYISSFELPHNLMKKPGLSQSEGFQVPETAHLWTCLLPTVGMDWAFTIIVELEVYLEGAHWNTLFNEIPSFEVITLGKVYVIMLVSCVIMIILIWYLDAAWPWQHGVSQPLYFPFTTSYWLGNKRSPQTPVTPTQIEKSFFEAEPPGKPVVCADHLRKSFGLPFFTKVAVKDVTLNIYSGQITVLLGHNGAGKTTTMGMLTGIIPPTSGTVTIDGFDIVTHTREARGKIGLCPQHNILYDELTVEEHLILYGVLKGIDEITLAKEIKAVASKLDLTRKLYSLSVELSGGMKRKLSLAIAMIGSPKVLILDEPTAGMDPEARRAVWELLFSVRREIAVLVSTHHMEEADVLGDRIAIMADGVVKCAGTSMFLKNKFGAGYHLIFAKADNFDYNKFKHLVWSKLPEALQGSETNTEITVTVDPKYTKKLADFFEVFEESKKSIGVASCGVTVTTMEDVFLQVGSTFKNLKGFSTPNINDYAVFVKRPHKKLPKKQPEPKVIGTELCFQQFVGLIIKRFNFARRYIPTIANALIVPAVVILILLELQRQTLNALDIPPFSIHLDLQSMYKDTEAFAYQNPANFTSKALQQVASEDYENEVSEEGVTLTQIKTDPNEYLLDKAKNDVNVYQKKHIISASFEETNDQSSIVAWYNGEALHSLPLSLNMVYRAMQRQIIGEVFDGDSGNIYVVNSPFPKKLFYRQWFVFPQLGRYLYLSFIPLSMAFIASAFILIPIHERMSKAKLVQLMTGVNRFLFWFCHFLFDFSTHILACILILLIFWIWDTSNIFFSSFQYGFGVFFIFLLFGFAIIPFVYLLSFAIDSQATGFAAVMMIVLLFGLILGYIIFVFQLLVENGTLAKAQFNIIYTVALICPPFSLTWGVQKLFYNGAASLLCDRVPENQKQAMCSLDTAYLKSMNLMGCCSDECEALCNRLTIMVNGKFRCLGSTQHLRSKFGQGFTIVIKLKRDMLSTASSKTTEKSPKSVIPPKEVIETDRDEHDVLIHFHVPDKTFSWAYLFKTMERAKFDLHLEDYQIGDTTLEQIFLAFARKQRKREVR
ncbi:ATP-binding cassette sub-family A member 1-like protein [Leptotrombidium deliense]|uniref:ATP-binding cassette sub-family A member 1-like protein n=1 Tax=Leptotrombidium deliense TaxID=299467 RepID=A0A443SSL4_9ACAR|nr:ATP-binding cassette sub-family A member 1-like protein [Leptotrombidium deliense]